MEVCDLATMEWHQQQTFGSSYPVFGKGSFSAVVGNHLYVFGGLDDEDYRNDIYRLHLGEFTWKQLSKVDAPSARSYGGMVSHGECVVVFGGLGKERLHPSFKGAEVMRDEKFGGEFTSEWNNSIHEYNTVTGNAHSLSISLSIFPHFCSPIFILPFPIYLLYHPLSSFPPPLLSFLPLHSPPSPPTLYPSPLSPFLPYSNSVHVHGNGKWWRCWCNFGTVLQSCCYMTSHTNHFSSIQTSGESWGALGQGHPRWKDSPLTRLTTTEPCCLEGKEACSLRDSIIYTFLIWRQW